MKVLRKILGLVGVASVLGLVNRRYPLRRVVDRNWPHPHLTRYSITSVDAAALARAADAGDPFPLELGDDRVQLLIEPTSVVDEECRIIEVDDEDVTERDLGETITYTGEVVEAEETTDVRLSVTDVSVSGYVEFRGDRWFIEPLGKFRRKASPQDHLAYRAADLRFELDLEDDVRPKKVEQDGQDSGSDPPHRVNPEIGIATVADREYYQQASWTSGSWFSHQRSLINMVNGIYETHLDCEFRVRLGIANVGGGSLRASRADRLLDELETYYEGLSTWTGGDLRQLDVRRETDIEVAHLTSGKNLAGSTLGVAWQPGVYSLSQQQLIWIGGGGGFGAPSLAAENLMIAAHELGHNFDGEHDEADKWCVTHFIWCWDYVRTIMWPTLYDDNVRRFSDGSRNDTHDNKQRIRNNMRNGRNRNF